jgi:hypothetical protein
MALKIGSYDGRAVLRCKGSISVRIFALDIIHFLGIKL